ncbi:unnamed protein product [Larinioides sclopetarius]|uniref:Exonuclease domain-containing protein n=1 Tax=Larinioides sclopetarius TaxID=280406 RepID=A0AAV1YZA8_9ARAC
MINPESPIAVKGSVLYLLPDSCDLSILNKGIIKTRSLSDLEVIHKTPLEDLIVDRHNSLSSTLTRGTLLPTASAVEAFVGPFKTLQEAQVAASLLTHETSHSSMTATLNLHQNISGCPNEPEKFTWTNPPSLLTTKGQGNKICSENPDASKMQANLCMSVTSSAIVSSVDNSEDGTKPVSFLSSNDGEKPEDSFENPEECKTEADISPVKKKTPKGKKESIPSITKVASLVFFDLETTGLAFGIGKSNVQITEVSMIAIGRKEFEESTYEDLRDIRIIQKLCLCTRPRSKVSSGAAAITGLNNENLLDQNPFEHNAAEAINFFLSHLPKPVCLLAHNGNQYDFPLLKAEFSRLSMSLPSDILIADTLKAFRVLGVPVFPPERKICESVKFTKRGQVSCSLSNLHLYLFNKNPTGSHSSEGDCIALAKVCHRMKDLMLLWIDENCTTFDSVSPMW